jgi:hypothetical protein
MELVLLTQTISQPHLILQELVTHTKSACRNIVNPEPAQSLDAKLLLRTDMACGVIFFFAITTILSSSLKKGYPGAYNAGCFAHLRHSQANIYNRQYVEMVRNKTDTRSATSNAFELFDVPSKSEITNF